MVLSFEDFKIDYGKDYSFFDFMTECGYRCDQELTALDEYEDELQEAYSTYLKESQSDS